MPATEFAGTTYTSTFTFASTLDLVNHTAVASVDTDVTSSLINAGDVVIAVPPAALEAGIAVQGCHTVAAGSFKLLGALNWMGNNLERIGARPVAAHSSGNFASGIAFAGMRFGKRVIVVMRAHTWVGQAREPRAPRYTISIASP